MSKIKDKLNESNFFLVQLEKYYNNYPEFDYFLNAFITSSRSISWIMRNEFGKISRWEKWYNSQKLTEDEEKFLKNISELRNRSQKKEPVKTKTQVVLSMKNINTELEKNIGNFMNKKVQVTIVPTQKKKYKEPKISKESITFIGKIEELIPTVREFPDKNILLVCKKYYSILESLVEDCENKFKKK